MDIILFYFIVHVLDNEMEQYYCMGAEEIE